MLAVEHVPKTGGTLIGEGPLPPPHPRLTAPAERHALAARVQGIQDRRVNQTPMRQGGPVDLAQRERLALPASPGPWLSWIEGRDHGGGDAFIGTEAEDLYPRLVVDAQEWNHNWHADQDFIAAVNPATILELIRRLREVPDC
jgi:hypothetical protein